MTPGIFKKLQEGDSSFLSMLSKQCCVMEEKVDEDVKMKIVQVDGGMEFTSFNSMGGTQVPLPIKTNGSDLGTTT